MRNLCPSIVMLLAASLSAPAAIDTGLLSLIPANSTLISSVDVQSARSSDFGQYLLRRINTEDQNFQEFAQQTGFDPRRDLQDFVFASTGPANDPASHHFVILARGNFDLDRIGTAAKTKGAVVQNYQGVDVFVNLVNASGHQRTAFAFPDLGIFAFGDLDTVQQVIANRSNPANLDPALQQLASSAGTENDAWFASLVPGSNFSPHWNPQAKQAEQAQVRALQAITESSGGVRFGAAIQLSFDAVTRSAKDASSLEDVVRFLATLFQMQAQKTGAAPQMNLLAPALANIGVRADGNKVHLSLSLPEKSLEQLADLGAGGNSSHARSGFKPTTR